MPENNITIKFKSSGAPALKTAINGLTNDMFLEKDDTPF